MMMTAVSALIWTFTVMLWVFLIIPIGLLMLAAVVVAIRKACGEIRSQAGPEPLQTEHFMDHPPPRLYVVKTPPESA